METKHTIEYATKLAKSFYPIQTTDFICSPALVRDAYFKGYMKAIKETAAPELLEALIKIKKLIAFNQDSELGLIINNAIKKATE